MQAKYIILILGLFCFFLCAHAAPTEEQKAIALADQYEKAYFDFNAEMAIFWGRLETNPGKFSDHSYAMRQSWEKKENYFLKQLNQLDAAKFATTTTYTTYALLKQTLENNKQVRICKEALWGVNPVFGWHNIMAIIAEKQPVGTDERRALALQRWQTFGDVVDQEIDNLKLGLSQNYFAPKSAVQAVLNQLELMMKDNAEESPFFDMAKRDNSAEFKANIAQLVTNTINPALRRYQVFLQEEYLAKARSEVGVWSIPHGKQCYRARIKQETTLDISPEQLHKLGLERMEALTHEVANIGKQEFNTKDMSLVFERALTNPKYLFKNEQDILNYNSAALERAKAKASQWFSVLPKAEGTIKPYPQHRAMTGASGEYRPPSEDGGDPGIFYINTYQPNQRSRVDAEATLFHELIPGHHYQVALSHEDKTQHSLNKYLWNSGYGEGWALYVERLADDMGLYSDNISRLGMLSNEALRTARLVVDSGIHEMKWTRQQAIDYLKHHTALSQSIVEGEVDRYIMMPGQANAYMIGKLEIESLRSYAQNKLGEQFDIREFHHQVLKNGAVSLPMLQSQIEQWVGSLS